jgi:hypothetical protein
MTIDRKTVRIGFSALVLSTMLGLSGCADNSNAVLPGSATPGLASGGATYVYAIQAPSSTSTAILQYSLSGSSTNLTPTATLNAPTGVSFTCLAVDSTGQIYAGAYVIATGVGEVLVYAAGSTGAATPSRTILGGTTTQSATFGQPISLQVTSAGTLGIFSYNSSGYSFATTTAATATGAVVPTTLLQGTSTGLYSAVAGTMDANGKIYITNYSSGGTGQVLVYAPGATGNTAPIATITTPSATVPYGIGTDSSGNIYVVVDPVTGSTGASVYVYASTATGAATPTRTISGSSTGINFGGGLRVDSVGNFYMINETLVGTNSYTFNVLAFGPTASGNVASPLNIASSALTSPDAQIAVR